jgi:hypothetical protein
VSRTSSQDEPSSVDTSPSQWNDRAEREGRMSPARVQNSGARDHHDATRFHSEGGSDVASAIEHGYFGERGTRAPRMKHLFAHDRVPTQVGTTSDVIDRRSFARDYPSSGSPRTKGAGT